jgi:hypothetical protein
VVTVRTAVLLMIASFLSVASGCAPSEPRTSRDVSGAEVEVNPPKTENFLEKVNAIPPGTPSATVRKQLGNPDEVRPGFIDARPEPGAAEQLSDLAVPGTRYEDWIYKRGDSHYHVFFTRGTRGGDAGWEVLTVRSADKDAVDAR